MKLSFRYRIYPTAIQRERLERSLDLLRDLYNAGLQERRDDWRLNRVRVTCFDQIKQLPEIRLSLNTDYRSVLARSMEQCLRTLDNAFESFFRRVKAGERPGYPRFKGKNYFNSIIYNREGYKFRGTKLHISFIGDLKIKLSRPFEGEIKEIRLRRDGVRWLAILSCDSVPVKPLPATGKQIGVDVGIESFATLSDGSQINNWRFYESAQKKLRIAQRKVARRTKGSSRRRKAVAIFRSIHQKIVRQRADFQHKLSTKLISENDLIAVEKLNFTGLARGYCSKQISDAGWSTFKFMLSYKAEKAGRVFVEVDPKYTSQDCSACGERVKKDLAIRIHNCSCGLSLHRDHNAAINILLRGLRSQDLTLAVAPCVS